jgi:hypothetical protein
MVLRWNECTDGSTRGGPAQGIKKGMGMTIDTTRTLVIRGSPSKLLFGLGMGVLMTALSVAVIFMPGTRPKLVGYVGIAFFGLGTVVVFWCLLTASRPVITISPEGIHDRRIASAVIPWTAVTGISTWQYRGQKMMVLTINPEIEERLGLTAQARWSRLPNRMLGIKGFPVPASGLTIDDETLLRTTQEYVRASQP